jgi:hypothetical protein
MPHQGVWIRKTKKQHGFWVLNYRTSLFSSSVTLKKVTEWCAISSPGIIRRYLFTDKRPTHVTVNQNGYRQQIVLPSLHDLQRFCRLVHMLTPILTLWCRILFEKLTVTQLVKNIPPSYGIRKFITVFTKARHRTLSWARRRAKESVQVRGALKHFVATKCFYGEGL